LSPIAVDAVLKIIDPAVDTNADLRDIKVVKKMGGTIEDTELIEGLVFTN
jgi:T-complex protein 1 subunit delta